MLQGKLHDVSCVEMNSLCAGSGMDQSGPDGEATVRVHLFCPERPQNHQVSKWHLCKQRAPCSPFIVPLKPHNLRQTSDHCCSPELMQLMCVSQEVLWGGSHHAGRGGRAVGRHSDWAQHHRFQVLLTICCFRSLMSSFLLFLHAGFSRAATLSVFNENKLKCRQFD